MAKKPPTIQDLQQAHNELALAVMLLSHQYEELDRDVTELRQRLEAALDVNVDDMEQD